MQLVIKRNVKTSVTTYIHATTYIHVKPILTQALIWLEKFAATEELMQHFFYVNKTSFIRVMKINLKKMMRSI